MYIKALLKHLISPFLHIADKSPQKHIADPVLDTQISNIVVLVVSALLKILFIANTHGREKQNKKISPKNPNP